MPLTNAGRSGRSIRRQVRIASVDGRPSRRKNEQDGRDGERGEVQQDPRVERAVGEREGRRREHRGDRGGHDRPADPRADGQQQPPAEQVLLARGLERGEHERHDEQPDPVLRARGRGGAVEGPRAQHVGEEQRRQHDDAARQPAPAHAALDRVDEAGGDGVAQRHGQQRDPDQRGEQEVVQQHHGRGVQVEVGHVRRVGRAEQRGPGRGDQGESAQHAPQHEEAHQAGQHEAEGRERVPPSGPRRAQQRGVAVADQRQIQGRRGRPDGERRRGRGVGTGGVLTGPG